MQTSRRINDKVFNLNLLDTASHGGCERLRTVLYPQTDVFIICFNVNLPASFENVRRNWFPEVRHHCPGAPFLIIGTQVDIRDNPSIRENLVERNLATVQEEDGIQMATELGAIGYTECSALTRYKLEDVFDQALLTALKPRPPEKPTKCLIL